MKKEENVWKRKMFGGEGGWRNKRGGGHLGLGKIVADERVDVGNIEGSIREVTQTSPKIGPNRCAI